ncbi:SlyX protein [Simplicispira metamorpha]|jgi:SlyX protein|uniref:SlyX protein n=2 Tax=Comamonadaceae TaxID=80864 RepID=A0A4V2SJR1_9BURK|nr:SlyX protein [Simplicispira metamorpha]
MPLLAMTHTHDTEQRLADLEIKASFNEDLLDQLNLTIYRQQQHIDWLLQEVRRLGQQQPEGGGAAPRSLRDELPPHY